MTALYVSIVLDMVHVSCEANGVEPNLPSEPI